MISKVRVKNFKAIQDSGEIDLINLNAFIGNNGSGKSSLIEALSLIRSIFLIGLSGSFEQFGGLEKVRHYDAKLKTQKRITTVSENSDYIYDYEPISIEIWGQINKSRYIYKIEINTSSSTDYYFVQDESLTFEGKKLFQLSLLKANGEGTIDFGNGGIITNCDASHFEFVDTQAKEYFFKRYVRNWNFLSIDPYSVMKPKTIDRSTFKPRMDSFGSKLGEVFLYLKNKDKEKYDLILEKMKIVLPYLSDIKPKVGEDFERRVSFTLTEKEARNEHEIPSLLFSSGTLRILSILTTFINIDSPAVIFIDEMENGLDPQTLALLLNEIKELNTKDGQVIITTHSLHLLNQLEKHSIILAEKDEKGQVTYKKANQSEMFNKFLNNGSNTGEAYSEYSSVQKKYKKAEYTID